jgi:hypothetical protein
VFFFNGSVGCFGCKLKELILKNGSLSGRPDWANFGPLGDFFYFGQVFLKITEAVHLLGLFFHT